MQQWIGLLIVECLLDERSVEELLSVVVRPVRKHAISQERINRLHMR